MPEGLVPALEPPVSRAAREARLAARRGTSPPSIVTLAGPAGAGRTTLTALVARTLATLGRQVLAIDLSPADALAQLFTSEEASGRLHGSRLSARLWNGLGCVAFGEGDLGPETSEPSWLEARLRVLVPPECDLVLFDTPRASHPLTQAAVAMADECVVVLDAPKVTPVAVEQARALFLAATGRRTLAVNKYDALAKAQRAALTTVGGLCGDAVVLAVVHAVEVMARSRTLDPGGASQACDDVRLLADGIVARLGMPAVSATQSLLC